MRLLFAALGIVIATAATPEFEVASIKPSVQTASQVAGVHIDGAQVRCVLFSLRDYIRMAYKVRDYQILGPEWMAAARFDINAKLPAGATPEQVPEMVGALLADRFQMKMHRETKEFAVYALAAGKNGLRMKETPAESDPVEAASQSAKDAVNVTATPTNGGTMIDMGKGSSLMIGNNRLEARKLTMPAFAETLAYFVDRPVVDMTEIKGNYDFTLEFSPEDFRAMLIRSAVINGAVLPPETLKLMETASGDSMFVALEKLGLKMEPRKAPLEVLVIDHMEKAPTENYLFPVLPQPTHATD